MWKLIAQIGYSTAVVPVSDTGRSDWDGGRETEVSRLEIYFGLGVKCWVWCRENKVLRMSPAFLVCTTWRKNGFREKDRDFHLEWIGFEREMETQVSRGQ